MAVVSLNENDNKENIPPLSSKQSTFVLAKPSSSNKQRRRLRVPLQDFTNLILPQICSTPAQSDTAIPVSSQASVSQPKCRKRRAENELGSICKKTCLVYKSGKFR
ncbi:hypothetical protein F3Y22_tig00111794pilonHSYRG00009 [Hibiscus syriacus]|uniref:Uncharacterized protein n=1 Tax=Hibiscus syriacus TaxID=106335 RepID=A0A6A2Y065_HIBSY|nr:hypothetical protein F3Y22_tig00111794pilonHSYRG00009 [Hibiscus syriacus]